MKILVDEMPKEAGECLFCYLAWEDTYICRLNNTRCKISCGKPCIYLREHKLLEDDGK